MNLKRLRGIAAVAFITIAAALFAGCSNSMAGSVDGDSNVRMATLSLSATGIPNEYAEQFAKSYPNSAKAAARSITPDTPFSPDASKNPTGYTLTFVLTGTSETGKKLDGTDAIKVTLSQIGSTNEYAMKDAATRNDVTLPSMSWNLVLTAYTDSPTNKKAVLQGFCSVDLRNGSGKASFKLSPENLTTPGEVEITGSFKPYDNVAKYTMGIYKKTSAGESLDEQEVTGITGDDETDFTYTCTPVEPGSYLYKMVFKNADGAITGSFIDTLIVDAGNPLKRSIGLIDVVNKKPDAPTDFNASLVEESENADGTYQVRLNWKSGVNGGETNFEVELTEYDDDGTTVASKKIYGMRSMDPATTEDTKTVLNFQGSDVWAGKGGAMTYGDTEAFFKLKLGVLYDVRIRARNYVGTSAATDADWTKRTIPGTTDTDKKLVGYANDKQINRFKIEYNLNGGVLEYYSGSNTYKTKTVNFTEYKTWEGSNIPLLVIGDNATDHHLKKGSSPFSKWLDSAKAPVTHTTNHKNLSVKADFGSAVTGSASMADAKIDVDISDIIISYGSVSSAPAQKTTYVIDKVTDGAATQLVIQLPTSGYKNIQFELSYNNTQIMLPYDDNTTNQCTLSLDEYVAGVIQVRVIADTANAIGMSQTLTFRLK